MNARKLTSKDTSAVSPEFTVNFHVPARFKMMIYPRETKSRGGFRAAQGRGRIELKCETQLDDGLDATMSYRLSIGSGSVQEKPRGPVRHNFAQKITSGLPPREEEWDFTAVVDEASQTFVICLEIIPKCAAGA